MNLYHLMLDQIVPSKTNPRRRYPEDKLQELADNIRQHGVMQPILVRPVDKDGNAILNGASDNAIVPSHEYEIVSGERRYRAARLAHLECIPAMVRELHDLEALHLQVFENLHRDDLHPMEEAEGFQQLLRRTDSLIGMTADELAAKVGKSRAYVYASLKLLDLCTYARDAFFDGKIGKETAVLVARIPGEKLQTEAIKEIIKPNYQGDGMSFRAAKKHIRQRYTLDLNQARFDRHSTTLLEAAGSCLSCPRRSGNTPELHADIDSPDVCTDPDCFAAKKAAHVAHLLATAPVVISGEEADKIAPYSVNSYVTNGYTKADSHHVFYDGRSIEGSYKDLLGDDMPAPTILVDKHDDVAEVYQESVLRQKLQEKIDAGEIELPEAEPREPCEWEKKRAEIEARQKPEQERREQVFKRIAQALRQEIPVAIHRMSILSAIRIIDENQSGMAAEYVAEAFGYGDSPRDFIDHCLQGEIDRDDIIRLLCLLTVAEGVSVPYHWEGGEEDDAAPDLDRLESMAVALGIDPDNPEAETAPSPSTAAPAKELNAPEETPVPDPFAEIKANELARRARKAKKEPAAAGADDAAAIAAGGDVDSVDEVAA